MELEKEGIRMSEEKRENKGVMKRISASFSTRKFKQGAYATTLSAIVIVIIIIINLFVSALDLNTDMTADGKFSLTEETKSLVKAIEDDITIYYLVQSGNELEEFKKIINNYDKLNDNVSVVYKDPVQYPKFASQYVDDDITEQSFLIVNETSGRAKYVAYNDVLDYQYDYYTGSYSITGLSIESKVDSALQAVTNEELPVVYGVIGHGETVASNLMKTLFQDGNITYNELNTLTAKEIPEDCNILYINQPQYDYTKEETDMILDHLKAGNKAIFCVDFTTNTLKNFSSILDYYGVTVVDGIVVESDSNYFRGNYVNELVPITKNHEFTQDFINSKFVICPVASGIVVADDLRDTVTTSEILKTSDTSFSKVNVNTETVDKEEGDIDGPFLLGVEVTEPVDSMETRLVVYSGKYMWSDEYIATNSFANVDLLYNTINQLTGQKNVITIRSISLSEDSLVLTQAQQNRYGLLLLAIIPFAFIVPGIVIVVRRRKK